MNSLIKVRFLSMQGTELYQSFMPQVPVVGESVAFQYNYIKIMAVRWVEDRGAGWMAEVVLETDN